MSFINQGVIHNDIRKISSSSSMPRLSLHKVSQSTIPTSEFAQSNMSFKRIMPNRANFNQLETREVSRNRINTAQLMGESYLKRQKSLINIQTTNRNLNRCNTERPLNDQSLFSQSFRIPSQIKSQNISIINQAPFLTDIQTLNETQPNQFQNDITTLFQQETFSNQLTFLSKQNKLLKQKIQALSNSNIPQGAVHKQYVAELLSQNRKLKDQNSKLKTDNIMLKTHIQGIPGISLPYQNVQIHEKAINQLNKLLYTAREQKNKIQIDLKMSLLDLEDQRKIKNSLLQLLKNNRQNQMTTLYNRIDHLQKYSNSLQKRNIQLSTADKQYNQAKVQIKQMEQKIQQLMETLRFLNDQFHAQKSKINNKHEMDILELNHEISRLNSILKRKDYDTNTSTPLKAPISQFMSGKNSYTN